MFNASVRGWRKCEQLESIRGRGNKRELARASCRYSSLAALDKNIQLDSSQEAVEGVPRQSPDYLPGTTNLATNPDRHIRLQGVRIPPNAPLELLSHAPAPDLAAADQVAIIKSIPVSPFLLWMDVY